MATDPFSSGTIARLEDRTQAYRFRCITGPVVHFSFYCCSNPPTLGVDKAPVCIMSATPETQCTGVNVTFNIDASYSPTGNLAGQPWRIDFGDGNFAAGNWGPPGNQVNAYAAAGIYIAEAYVTDTLAVRGSTEVTVEIIDCANDTVLIEQMYALSQTTGPWVKDVAAGGAPPPWTQCIGGLAGNWLVGRDLKLDCHRKRARSEARLSSQAPELRAASRLDDQPGGAGQKRRRYGGLGAALRLATGATERRRGRCDKGQFGLVLHRVQSDQPGSCIHSGRDRHEDVDLLE